MSMNKAVYLRLIIFILVLIIVAAFYTKVEAKTIELTGSEKGLYVTSDNNELFNIVNFNPGQTVKSNLTIKNNYSEEFDLFFKPRRVSEAVLEGEPDLEKQLKLTVKYKGKDIYNGNMSDFDNADDSIALGTFSPGETQNIDVTVYLPGEETGNEFQGKSVKTEWVFTASRMQSNNEKVMAKTVLPNTGHDLRPVLYSVLGGTLILLGAIWLMKVRKKY